MIELTSKQGYTKLRVAPEAVKFVYEHDGVTTIYVDGSAALDVEESVEQVEKLREQALALAATADEHARVTVRSVTVRNRFSATRPVR